uniref:Short-chain collagen C4-like n=1 Tax=Branchiostoma floridae TaxID=7739 RepID=C3YXM6_BRAFL|eukprot:XP_002598823.1 hypothetical protein BRAFLDRAFT_74500 [Branchiostoma floridae]
MVAPVFCFLVVVLAGAQAVQPDDGDWREGFRQLQQMMMTFAEDINSLKMKVEMMDSAEEIKTLKVEMEDMRKTMATADVGLAGNDGDDLSRNKRQIYCEDGLTEEAETSACTLGLRGRDGRDGAPGRDGAAGRDGQPGLQGPIGEKGDIGPEGPQGEQGEKGEDGDGGIAGGSHFTHSGGGANYVCLPKDPEWGVFMDGNQGSSYMQGAEYQDAQFGNSPFQGASVYDHDVPCAVCHVASRGSKLMIPARLSCPSGWTMEYKGYLMTERYNHNRSEFVCVDGEPETRPGGQGNVDGALFYPVEADCGALPCPNYVQGRELTCVVCTK